MIIAYGIHSAMFKIKKDIGEPAVSYGLFAQKQPGTKNYDFTSYLKFPRSYSVNWKYATDNLLSEVENGLQYRTELEKDKAYAVVFVK